MNDTTVIEAEGHEALLTEEGHSKVESAKAYALLGLAAVGAFVVGKKVLVKVKSSIKTRKSMKNL